jgi:hypothetical protein
MVVTKGLLAAKSPARILEGTPPAAIPPRTAEAGSYRFSIHELARFGNLLASADQGSGHACALNMIAKN